MNKIYAALALAIREFTTIKKTASGQYGSYADLQTVIDEIKPVLDRQGLFFIQPFVIEGGENVLLTMLVHAESGETLASKVKLVTDKPGPQGLGASITYLRRYSLLSLLGIATSDDPDAHHGHHEYSQQPEITRQQTRQAPPSTASTQAAPYVQPGDRPDCPKCGHKMMLSQFENKVTKAFDWYCNRKSNGCGYTMPRDLNDLDVPF